MNLLNETLLISGTMILLCSVPLLSEGARKHSKLFFLLGTGALSGILFFDLLPDVFQMGGPSSLLAMGIVWGLYSLIHLSHLGHHHHDQEAKPSLMFLVSMMTHCLTSGMLLVVSYEFSHGIAQAVFLALLVHKAYEALTVSTVLIEQKHSKLKSLILISLYALSLPAGVGLTLLFRSSITQGVAIAVSSVAVGTLLGCLIHDFLIPSISHLKNRRLDLGWIAIGLLVTQIVMRNFS